MALYLADTSAWQRRGRVDRWRDLVELDQLAICTPIKLELLVSARTPAEYESLARDLDALPHLPLDERVEFAAERAQSGLASRSRHRGPTPVDLLIAAVAETHDAVLLHYDRHFDEIGRVTGQHVEWIADRGSLD